MNCVIGVYPLNDNEELSYSNIKITHSMCKTNSAKLSRNPASNEFSIRCDCGFEVTFIEGDQGLSEIMKTAISGQETTIDGTYYYPNGCENIVVRKQG